MKQDQQMVKVPGRPVPFRVFVVVRLEDNWDFIIYNATEFYRLRVYRTGAWELCDYVTGEIVMLDDENSLSFYRLRRRKHAQFCTRQSQSQVRLLRCSTPSHSNKL